MTRRQRQDRRLEEATELFHRRVEGCELSFDERGALFILILERLEDRDNAPEDERLAPKALTRPPYCRHGFALGAMCFSLDHHGGGGCPLDKAPW